MADHAQFRKAIGATFSDKVVKLQESIITQYVDLMVKKLHQAGAENAGKVLAVDVIHWLILPLSTSSVILDGANFSIASRNRITALGSPFSYNFGLS